VVLLGRVWREKLLRDHPELALHVDAMLRAVQSPDHAEVDLSSRSDGATTDETRGRVDGCWWS
jgi:hypothetical protein